jgi:hypothetical protein
LPFKLLSHSQQVPILPTFCGKPATGQFQFAARFSDFGEAELAHADQKHGGPRQRGTKILLTGSIDEGATGRAATAANQVLGGKPL